MPIVFGCFNLEIDGSVVEFGTSVEGAKIISDLVHDIQTHDSLKVFPLDMLKASLHILFGGISAGECVADSESSLIQAEEQALYVVLKYIAKMSGYDLSVEEFRAWLVDSEAEYSSEHFGSQYIFFTTGRDMTLPRLQNIVATLPAKLKVNAWGHIFDDTMTTEIKVTILKEFLSRF